MSSGNTDAQSDDIYCLIDLSGKNQTFNFLCSYGYQPVQYEATGTIDGKTYTTNSPITCDSYYGSSNGKSWFMETARLSINLALVFLDDYINQKIPEIDITDLGFANF